jgi:hypothetical protein
MKKIYGQVGLSSYVNAISLKELNNHLEDSQWISFLIFLHLVSDTDTASDKFTFFMFNFRNVFAVLILKFLTVNLQWQSV